MDAAIGLATSGFGAWSQLRHTSKLVAARRAEGVIVGNAQKTGTFMHGAAAEYRAVQAVEEGASQVFLNKSVGVATQAGKALDDLARRPDVMANFDDYWRFTEVASKTDDVAALYSRLNAGALASGRAVSDEVIQTSWSFTIPGTSRMVGMSGLPATYGLRYSAGWSAAASSVIYGGGAMIDKLGVK